MPERFAVTSRDGTVVQGWRSGGGGVPVVLSNGLGTSPQSWPALVDGASGYDVVTWYHRGTGGSARPSDPARVRVEDHLDDLLAVMDACGLDSALVACWSIGVNVGFELARAHPERVRGLLAVAGVPGGTFAAMGGPWRVPRRLRAPLATGVARAARALGPALGGVVGRVPVDRRTAWLLAHSGVVRPAARPEVLVPVLREFLQHDWRWYFHLALGAAAHAPVDLSGVRCPVTLVAGRSDVLTSVHDVVAVADRLPHAQVTVLPGSHFLPVEHPELVLAALDELQRRVVAGAA